MVVIRGETVHIDQAIGLLIAPAGFYHDSLALIGLLPCRHRRQASCLPLTKSEVSQKPTKQLSCSVWNPLGSPGQFE